MWKICTKCNKHKALWAFQKQRCGKFGTCSQCKSCRRIYNHNLYLNDLEGNRHKRAEYYKDYYPKVREHKLASNKKWLEENSEYRKIYKKKYNKKYYRNNKDVFKEAASRRYATIKNQTPKDRDKDLILKMYKLKNVLSRFLGLKLHMDHILPISRGGEHRAANLQIVPASYNLSMKDKIKGEVVGITKQDLINYKELFENILRCGEI